MKKNLKTKYSAISMAELGIDTVVLTPHNNLENIFAEFENEPDFIWADGKGKKFLYESLYETLKQKTVDDPHRMISSRYMGSFLSC